MMSKVDDDIVEETRRRRQAHAESFDYDLVRIVEDLQRQERESAMPVVRRSPRHPQLTPKRTSA